MRDYFFQLYCPHCGERTVLPIEHLLICPEVDEKDRPKSLTELSDEDAAQVVANIGREMTAAKQRGRGIRPGFARNAVGRKCQKKCGSRLKLLIAHERHSGVWLCPLCHRDEVAAIYADPSLVDDEEIDYEEIDGNEVMGDLNRLEAAVRERYD
jgi:predicted RNA-binding Zn-ribbon protein involved in translation (DUF1610 family)